MKKRFALIVAGGLVAVLIAASAALSLGLLGASAATGRDRATPRVRTVDRTVTVHRTPKPSDGTLVLAAPGQASSRSGGESEFQDDDGSSGHDGGGFDDD